MALKAFYAWQSDRPSNLNRSVIKAALDDAAKEIGKSVDLDDALRELQIDQDTQGVPGSPPIAETILAKIGQADLFVGDLTFANDVSEAGRQAPNPNVMLEYGYALHALGDSRMIGVFNEFFGPASQLPFDLVHRRWPIRFRLGPEDGDDIRRAVKKQLKTDLVTALKAALPTSSPNGLAEAFQASVPQDGIGAFVEPGGELAVRRGVRPTEKGHSVAIKAGPYAYLRVIPTKAITPLSNVEADQLARDGLAPFGFRDGGFSTGRNSIGSVVYWVGSKDLDTAWGSHGTAANA